MQDESNRRQGSEDDIRSVDYDFEMVLGGLDMEALTSERAGNCPPQRDLSAYADLSLDGERRTSIADHLMECPACACLAMQMGFVSSPVKRLHTLSLPGLFWRYLWTNGRLSPPLESAWERHRERCRRCDSRARLLARLGVRAIQGPEAEPIRTSALQRLVPVLAFGMGVLLAVLLMPRPAPAPGLHFDNNDHEPKRVEKGGSGAIPDTTAEGQLDLMLRPTTLRLDTTIEAWDTLAPDLKMEKAAALGGIYSRAAEEEKDRSRRANLLKTSERELLKSRKELDLKLGRIRDSLSALSGGPSEVHVVGKK